MTKQRVTKTNMGPLMAGGLGGLLTQFGNSFGTDAPFASELRQSIIIEEWAEFEEAWADYVAEAAGEDGPSEEVKTQLLKEVCDVIYVLVGGVIDEGWHFNAAFCEIHLANMAKLGEDGKPVRRADGKVGKPDGWVAADLSGCV